jgi:hypothetical protein
MIMKIAGNTKSKFWIQHHILEGNAEPLGYSLTVHCYEAVFLFKKNKNLSQVLDPEGRYIFPVYGYLKCRCWGTLVLGDLVYVLD